MNLRCRNRPLLLQTFASIEQFGGIVVLLADPAGRMELIDYVCENQQLFKRQFADASAGSYATPSRGGYFTLSRALFKKHHSMALKIEASAGHGEK